MSHAARRPRKTLEDYLALPDDVRAELIDGELYVTPSPRTRHQRIAGVLFRRLAAHAETRGLGEVFIAPLDVHLPTGDIVQPDVLFVAAGNRSIVREYVHGAPDLVVEVLSPRRPERDRFVKRVLYAHSGVGEYWIVDPDERSIEVLRHLDRAFAPAAYVTGEQDLTSPTLPGFRLLLVDLFDG